jgi:CTP-dependent riboflavin kinase
MFSRLINDNRAVFRRYFGVELFAGSLNIDVPNPPSLQMDLDAGTPPASFVIPANELINMPSYIGDGRAWNCLLTGDKFPAAIQCWIFRRKGSRVPKGVIEIVAPDPLRERYGLHHGDSVQIALISPVPPILQDALAKVATGKAGET